LEDNPALGNDPAKQFYITGIPKLDRLCHANRTDGESFLASHALSTYIPTIFIGSHYTPESLLLSMTPEFVERICARFAENNNVIVMGHGRLWRQDGIPVNVELSSRLKLLESTYPNFRFLPSLDDTVGFLQAADVFIGDNSSIFVEYCIVDKPIALFRTPGVDFGSLEVQHLYESASQVFSDLEGVESIIIGALGGLDNKQEKRKEVTDFFVAQQGRSTEYIVNILEKLGRINGPKSSSWDKVIKLSREEMR
jgi:hypothetical protein